MVNETFVHRFFHGANPLSHSLQIAQLRNGTLAVGPPVEWQIVGVFHDVQNNEQLGRPNHPEIYAPFAQSPWPQAVLAVRTTTPPKKIIKAVAAAVHSVDRNLPLANVRTMEQIARDRFVEDRFGTALYGSLAGIGLLLAAVGIYGVMSYTVSQQVSEIGLRMALGASSQDVLLRLLKQGLQITASGVVLGFIGGYVVGKVMQSMLYGTGSLDWLALSSVAILLLGCAFVACYIPARRAAHVDPIRALRYE
jgi:putative ABC transport system permease protein